MVQYLIAALFHFVSSLAPAGWVQLLLQEENLLIVAGVAGAIGILLIVLLTTAVAIVLRKRMKGM